jgi:hypothetical protein
LGGLRFCAMLRYVHPIFARDFICGPDFISGLSFVPFLNQ